MLLGGLSHASWWVSRLSPRVYEALMPALHDAKVTVMRDMEAWLAHHVAEGPFVPFE